MASRTSSRGAPAFGSSSLKQRYLLAYNALSCFLWTIITLRTIVLIPILLPENKIYLAHQHLFSPLLIFTQSLAILEVFHAILGLVRASPVTTFIQVASRYLVVWFVVYMFPEVVVGKPFPGGFGRLSGGSLWGQWAFVGCLCAWGVTEVIKYGFFVAQLGLGGAPNWLNWLRYNTFFVLYPVGISSEVILIVQALKPAGKFSPTYVWFLISMLVIYVPGSFIMYTHMMSQRRKVMKGKSKSKNQ